MSVYFLDTSALGKRYVVETGTKWISTITDPSAKNVILISELAIAEFNSILARRLRDGVILLAELGRVRADFLLHVDMEYKVILLNSTIVALASELLIMHPLRTLDALQLASAVVASKSFRQSITFISGDNRLLSAAEAEGFPIDNPYNHP